MAELNNATRSLETKKSPGKDGVCNEIIHYLGSATRQKLHELFNQSSHQRAIIITILKKE